MAFDIYPLCKKSSRIAAIVYMTETKSPYGTADYNLSKRLWNGLKFNVRQLKDPSRSVLKNWVQKLVAEINVNDTKHDALSFTFIGHGHCRWVNQERQCEYMVLSGELNDEFTILTFNELREMFTASECPGLVGKPIIIILQCCRGEKQEVPVYVTASGTGVISPSSELYILYGSAPRHASHYNLQSGESLLIKTVCEVFENNYMNQDIMTMTTTVLAKINTTPLHTGYCQTAFVESSLRKLLYFHEIKGILPRAVGASVPLPQHDPQNSTGFGSTAHALSQPITPDVQCNAEGQISTHTTVEQKSVLSRQEGAGSNQMTTVNQQAASSIINSGSGNQIIIQPGGIGFFNI